MSELDGQMEMPTGIGTMPVADRPKWIVFDTETTGLFDLKKRAHEHGQPRLATLTMIWTTSDLALVGEKTIYIKPDGWYMPPEAGRVNGLTTEFLMAHGVPVQRALDLFNRAVTAGYAFCAFNADFDTKVMRGELRRAGLPDRYAEVKTTCVMERNRGVCKIPYKDASRAGYKNPRLAEALAHWKIPQVGAHTSAGDAHSALALLRCLDTAGIDITPETPKLKEND